jgi:hypothetical protein
MTPPLGFKHHRERAVLGRIDGFDGIHHHGNA